MALAKFQRLAQERVAPGTFLIARANKVVALNFVLRHSTRSNLSGEELSLQSLI
jgi:hypothetical protein